MIKTKKRIRLFALFFVVLVSGALVTGAVAIQRRDSSDRLEWPMFRGVNGSGVSDTTGLPLEFGPDTSVIWKIPFPAGHSSPVIAGDRLFLTAEEGTDLMTICLDRRTGKTMWRKKAPRPRRTEIDQRNHPASPSPVTDGQSLYVFFPDFGLLAYDLDGNELWRFPLGPFDNFYGMGASPVVAGNNVVLVCDVKVDSFLIALNKKTGKLAWKTLRPEAKSGHSTPIIYKPQDNEVQILVPGSFFLMAYSAATGKKLWWVGGLSFEMKSIPVIKNDILYINGYASPLNQPDQQKTVPEFSEAQKLYDKNRDGKLSGDELPRESPYDWLQFCDLDGDNMFSAADWNYFQAALASLNGMLAIRLGGKGDMTEKNSVWQYRRSVPQLPSPLLYKNVLYMLSDGGIVTCFNPDDGEVISQGRIRGAGSHFYASPVAADGKVFIISLRGVVTVLAPDGQRTVLSQTELREECYATPALVDGKIYLRTVKTLYCFGLEK